MPLIVDFETRSDADLKAIGGRLYWAHPSTEPLCCVAFDTADGELLIWVPGAPGSDAIKAEIAARATAHNWAAHNATGFDRFGMAKHFGVTRPDWIDTSELARTAGLPGSLDALGSRWLGLPKDKTASAYVRSLSRRNKAGQWLHTPDMDRVIPYCVRDVEILGQGFALLDRWRDLEPDVVHVDRAINDRGIRFDRTLANRLTEIDAVLCNRAVERAARVWNDTPDEVRKAARSPQQFTKLTGLPDAQKQTIDDALHRGALPPQSVALCEARRALASIARGKLEAGRLRTSDDDDRLRDSLRYYGAHTGRWSGRGMQLQNLPRPDKRFETWTDDDVSRLFTLVLSYSHIDDAALAEISRTAGYEIETAHVDLLLRGCLFPKPGHKLIARDFASVEARGLAWCAGCSVALEAFKEGNDLYKIAASSIYGAPYDAVTKPQRQIGKVAELALGYQGGAGALEKMARAYGVNLTAPGIPPPKQIVEAWRKARPAVVALWRGAQSAFAEVAGGGASRPFAKCTFDRRFAHDGVAIVLPSGRPIVYNDVTLTSGLEYLGAKEAREHIYGGKIVENLIQGLCRDLMARAMVAAEAAGLPVVLTVHDEIVCEVEKSAAPAAALELDRIMKDLPKWAKDFPIAASGFDDADRYRK